MTLSPELIDELNTLLLYNVTDPQEGIKVHKEAGAAKIAERWAAALSPLLPARNR